MCYHIEWTKFIEETTLIALSHTLIGLNNYDDKIDVEERFLLKGHLHHLLGRYNSLNEAVQD